MANNRKRHSQIKTSKIGSMEIDDEKSMQDHVHNHFKEILGMKWNHVIKFKEEVSENIDTLIELDEFITEEETKEAIRGQAQVKAPGLDGFSILFYTTFLEVIREDFLKLIK